MIDERINDLLQKGLMCHLTLKKKKQDELANEVLAFTSSLAQFALMVKKYEEPGQRKEEYDRS